MFGVNFLYIPLHAKPNTTNVQKRITENPCQACLTDRRAMPGKGV